MRRLLLGPLTLATIAVAAACSFSASTTPTVDKSELAKEVSSQLEKQVGKAPDSVECPEDLEGKVGQTLKCTLKDGDQTYGVTVTVTKVEGTDVNFDIKVDDHPQ